MALPEPIELPPPLTSGSGDLAKALARRRSCRELSGRPLDLPQVSQLLWAAYGVTAREGGYDLKTAPSAGALYPLEILAVTGEDTVTGLAAGVFRYRPTDHQIDRWQDGDRRRAVARACVGQTWLAGAPVVLVVSAVYPRITGKYGDRGLRYAHMEAGNVSQNLSLQAEALGLGTCIVGAFEDGELAAALGLLDGEDPLLALPVGHPS